MARRRRGRPITGWINLDKPKGMTSAQAVAAVKRLLDAQKVGHGGTLDPLATGVLPIALGEATKMVPFLMDRPKSYVFTVRWGEARATDDAEGAVIARSAKRPTAAAIEAALPAFTGVIQQVPPAFSAIKVDGARAYDLARAGETVDLPPRAVEVMAFARQGTDADPQIETRFHVTCGKGTYVRALARDLGVALGTYGYVAELARSGVGGLRLADAISLETLAEMVHKAAPRTDYVRPMTAALDDILALAVTTEEARRVMAGQPVMHRGVPDGLLCLSFKGEALAMAEAKDGRLQPVRVFNLKKQKERNDVD
ncbi:MAG: tRNA pseudouridine(55) synthase TruB [Pseudomonadota bacterium]|jgi:tRNA pseudouridine55 synthase